MKKYKLGELLEITRGASLSGEFYSTEGELIRLTLGNFDYQNGGFKENTSKDDLFFTGEVKPQFILNEGDIITPLTEQTQGLIGSTARIPKSGVYIQSQDVALVKCNEELLDPTYCYYLLPSQSVKKQLSAGAQQTKIRHTSPDKIKDVTVFIPELKDQKRIGELLSTIDSQIDNLTAINRNLEQVVKQLYDYWFVQFEFPDDEGKPYRSSGGVMVWNEKLKRMVPALWNVVPLESLGSFKNGINYSRDELGNYDYKIVNVRNISSSSLFIDTQTLDGICLMSETADNYLVKDNDILIARSGTPGATRILQEGARDVIYCGFIICFSVHRKSTKPLLTYQLKDLERITNEQSNGSILSNISQDVLKRIQAIMPPDYVLQEFNQKILPIWDMLDILINEKSRLITLRDELMPLLLNGQVSVGNRTLYDFKLVDTRVAAESGDDVNCDLSQ